MVQQGWHGTLDNILFLSKRHCSDLHYKIDHAICWNEENSVGPKLPLQLRLFACLTSIFTYSPWYKKTLVSVLAPNSWTQRGSVLLELRSYWNNQKSKTKITIYKFLEIFWLGYQALTFPSVGGSAWGVRRIACRRNVTLKSVVAEWAVRRLSYTKVNSIKKTNLKGPFERK